MRIIQKMSKSEEYIEIKSFVVVNPNFPVITKESALKAVAMAEEEMKRKAIQQAANKLNDTIPDALWNTDDEEMMLKLRGKQQYK